MEILNHLKSFANERRADKPVDIFNGQVIWSNYDIKFRFSDFSNYIKEQGYLLRTSELREALEAISARRLGNTHIAKKQVRPWAVTIRALKDSTPRFWKSEVPLEYRKRLAQKRGHPEWVLLPVSPENAEYTLQNLYFEGKRLMCGHISAQKLDGSCLKCEEFRIRRDQKMKTSMLKRFDNVADLIAETGRLHYLNESEKIIALRTPVRLPEDVIRDGCRRAAEKTVLGGRWYAKPSGNRMKILPVLTPSQRHEK
jgi:hypothetical protein